METLDIRQVLLFLAKVPSDSNVRLMLQLALASDVPVEKFQGLEQKVLAGQSLTDLLKQEQLLVKLLEADGEIGIAEENMLFEAVDQIGLVVPSDRKGAKLLLENLTEKILKELE